MKKKFLPLAAMGAIIKQSGDVRASQAAKKALNEELEEIAKDIAEKAVRYSKHAGRRTVLEDDVKLALK